MLKIKQIDAKGIRGIVDGPSLRLSTSGLILCGDNGTGKSSYVDAVEKVLTGSCSSLDKVGQGVSWNKQGHHLTAEDSNISITLSDGNKDIVVDLNTDISTLDSQAKKFIEAAQQHSFILRRRTLLNFIDSKPSERYQAIEKFINIDEFNGFEDNIKSLGKKLDTSIENAKNKRAEHETALRDIFGLNKKVAVTESNCIETINSSLEEVNLPQLESLEQIQIRIQEISNLISPVKDIAALQKIQALYELIGQVPSVENLFDIAQKFANDRKELQEEESKNNGHLYVQVLETGLSWIKEDNLNNCPLCNNPITLADVENHVSSCLENNKEVIALRSKVSNSRSTFVDAAKSFAEALERISLSWKTSVKLQAPVDINASAKTVKSLIAPHKNILTLQQIENDIVKLTTLDLAGQVLALKKFVEKMLSEFPGSERYLKLFDTKSKLLGFETHFTKGVTKVSEKIEKLSESRRQVAIVLEIAEMSRKETVQKLLNAIVNIADTYFQKIHPGEEIGKPELIVTNRGTGSI